jgi:ABC-type Fe3+-siderophore transport system permease subunit
MKGHIMAVFRFLVAGLLTFVALIMPNIIAAYITTDWWGWLVFIPFEAICIGLIVRLFMLVGKYFD